MGLDLGGSNSPAEFINQEYSRAVLPRRGFHGSGEGPGSSCVDEQHSPGDECGGPGHTERNMAAL